MLIWHGITIFRNVHFNRQQTEQFIIQKQMDFMSLCPMCILKCRQVEAKTLLACHSIDLIHKSYLKKQTGLILWIVPSTQIYRQTILALKNREHPYRQILDISSGGRTLIKEKTEMFNRLDVEENLVVLMLMLPSANRLNRDTLKVFRDAGGFTDFFPAEDNYPAQQELLKLIPNPINYLVI